MPTPAQPLLLLIAAPSGGGKTTVCQQLLQTVPDLHRAVTCTTRPPRAGERDGADYHFLTPPEFARRLAQDEFLEHAEVYGHHYGTWKTEVLARLHADQNVLLNVDVQGAASLRAAATLHPTLARALVTVFLTPASLDVLAQRLARRGLDAPDVVARRLAAARQEIARWREFDYLVLSTTVAEDLRRVQAILEVERLRTSRVRTAPGVNPPPPPPHPHCPAP